MRIRHTLLFVLTMIPIAVGSAQSTGKQSVEEVPDIGVTPLPRAQIAAPGHYLNVSTRVQLRKGEAPAALGFVVDESTASLIRIVGPTLAKYSVTNPAMKPHAELYVSGRSFGPLRKWKDHSDMALASISSIASAIGAFPLDDDSDDLVLFFGSQKGSYTIEVSAEDTVGTVLIEIYRIPEDILNQ